MRSLKKQLTKLSPLSAGIVLVFAAAMSYILAVSFAATGTATLYTSPGGSQSITNGQNFTVNVRISASSSVSGAEVKMSYPADKVQVQSIDYTGEGGVYNFPVTESNAGGILNMVRGALPVIPASDKLFAQVTFKAVANGQASIGFTDDSTVLSGEDDSNILSQKNGVSYNISTPSSGGGGGNTGGSSGGTSSGSTSKPSGSSSTSKPSGSTNTGGSSTPQTTTPDAGTPSGSSNIPSTTGLAEDNSSGAGIFEVLVVDKDNNPVKGAEVTIDGKTLTTDESGIARFDSVAAGKKDVVVNYKGKKTLSSAEVKGLSTSSPQSLTVEVDRSKLNPMVLIIPPLAAMLLAAGFFFLRPMLRARSMGMHKSTVPHQPDRPLVTPIYSNTPQPGNTFQPNPPNSSTGNESGESNLPTQKTS